MLRNKKVMFAVGSAVFLGSTYFTYSLTNKMNNKSSSSIVDEQPHSHHHHNHHHSCSETRNIYNKISSKYDSKVNFDEHLIGVTKLRKQVFNDYVKGPYVLEVAAGTGRNMDLITDKLVPNRQIACVDVTDYSDQMLQQAYIKYVKWQRKQEKKGRTAPDKLNFKLVDAHNLSSELSTKHYDTVIDTYGMCSFENPEKVLREMVKVCKPDGRIILLEHGRTMENKTWIPLYRTWLNNYLDKSAPKRAQDWGCWWNRDIEEIVEKCRDVIHVEERKYYQFGTCYLIIARPRYLQEIPNTPSKTDQELAAVASLLENEDLNPTSKSTSSRRESSNQSA